MSENRTLWKYPNRRLYDTTVSTYVHHEHIRELLTEGVSVDVFERRSGRELTRSVLTQLLLEMEERAGVQGLLKQDLLVQLIYCQEKLGAEVFSQYLDECLRLFLLSPPESTLELSAQSATEADVPPAQPSTGPGSSSTMS